MNEQKIPTPKPQTIWLASFDIGKKNFAFCIEEVEVNLLYKPPDSLATVYQNGRVILLENKNLTANCHKNTTLETQHFINMTHVLDQYKAYWNQCTTFLIEQQMSFGSKRNTMALKLGQHCFSYFVFHFANFKTTIDYPAYNKTQLLGAPKKMNKYQRKKWAIDQAMKILLDRNDVEMLDKLMKSSKKDDMADCILMINSYKCINVMDKN